MGWRVSGWDGRLVALLTYSPGLSAREIASRLRGEGFDVHKRDLNPLLYRDSRFENDSGRVPRWRVAGTATASMFDRDARGAARRAKREELDRRQEAVATVRAAGPVGHAFEDLGVDDDVLRQAMAILRSRGLDVGGLSSPAGPPAVRPPVPQPPARAGSRPSSAPKPAPGVSSNPAARRARGPRPGLPVPTWTQPLRAWQAEALAHWYEAGGTGVCEAVTGTGKTHLGLEAVAQAIRSGQRATVLVPSVLLQRQWEQQMQRHVPEAVIAKVGGVKRGVPEKADVVIAVVNSATRHDLSRLGANMSLLVADEAHRYGGAAWSEVLREGYTYRLGLTATLERGSDEGVAEILDPYFGGIVHRYGFDRATRERVVAPFDLVFLGVSLDDEERSSYDTLSRKISQARKVLIAAGANPRKLDQQLGALRSVGGEVTRAVITYESATRERRRLLAETSAKHDALESLTDVVGESRGTVIFTQSKETADVAASLLQGGGLRAEAIYSEGMGPARRQELIDQLGDEQLDALAAPKILDEGVDIPDIDLGIVMGASSARRQMIQRLGRVIRLKQDGRRARFVVLYVIGSVEDPESGTRDDFMAEVEDAATRIVLVQDWDEDTIDQVWNGTWPVWDRGREVPDGQEAAPAPSIGAPPPAVAPAAAVVPDPAVPELVVAAPDARRDSPEHTQDPAARSGELAPSVLDADPVPDLAPVMAAVEPPGAGSPERRGDEAAIAPGPAPAAARAAQPAPPVRAVPRVAVTRPRPRRPEYPDPIRIHDLIQDIEESRSLVEWVREQSAAEKVG